jgi:arylsulfatase
MNNLRLVGHFTASLTLMAFNTNSMLADNNQDNPPKKKPNVIILFSDQHHKNVMGYEGHPDVITPHLDKFASQSVIFERAYCTVGISAPSRTSLMTGLYPRTIGLLSNSERTSVMNDAVTLATVFQKNNYRTYAFGKRHLYGGSDAGWDVHQGHLCDETPGNSYTEWVERNGYGKEFAMDWAAEFSKGTPCSQFANQKLPIADLGTRLSALPENMTMEAFTTQLTIKMIREHAKSKEPFFCWSTFYRPHQPYTPLKKYMDMYDFSNWGNGRINGSSIQKPASLYEPKENLPPMLQGIRNGENKVWNVNKAFENEQIWRYHIAAYYALVTEIDHCIGEILKALDESGIADETIVIYTSDHGDFVGNHGMVEKAAMGQNVYEDILNVPLIIRIPGNKQNGKRVAELVSLVDIYPTLVELLGLEMPKVKHPVQGLSLANTITKGKTVKRKYVVSESWSQATVITKDFKLGMMIDPTEAMRKFDFRSFGDQFFVRKTDSLEVKNQINNAAHKSEIEKLRAYYLDFTSKIPDIGKQEVINSTKIKK